MTFSSPLRVLTGYVRHLSVWLLLGISIAVAGERAQVTILGTTDLHGRIYPVDYFTDKPANVGLAKIATLITKARETAPDALLVDSGDTIQGTPLAYYHNRKNNTPPDPMMLVMSSLGYTSMSMGNHEYNFGLGVLEKAHREAAFPWLSANTYKAGTDECAYEPYVVKEVRGVRVGILGMTTPAIPNWENPENYAGLEFRPLVSEARKWIAILKDKEHVDSVVIAMHSGVGENIETGRIPPGQFVGENAAIQLAREVPGIDAMLLGHTHVDIPALVVNDVLICQAGRWGDHLAKVELTFERGEGEPWHIIAREAETIPVRTETAADAKVLELGKPYHEETEAWLSRPIGHCAKTIGIPDRGLSDSALLDLIQHAQLEAGRADISFAANFNLRASVREGDVTVRDISSLYVYENTLYVVEATGAQVKAALEHSARYFLPYVEGKTAAELIDHEIPGYNFDSAEGVSYEIDLRRPQGDRILNLTFEGRPIDPDRVFRVAINNYRYNGGGGYTMFKGAKVVDRSSTEIRDLIIAWVEKHGEIPAEADGNWRILP